MPRFATFAAALLFAPAAIAQLTATPRKPGGVYAVGEPVAWRVEAAPAVGVKEVSYVFKRDGLTPLKEGVVDVSGGPVTVEVTPDGPASVLLELRPKGGDKPAKVLAGALVAPEKLTPSMPPPADFDAFWAAKIKELQAVPANPRLVPADAGKPGVDYFKLRMDNIAGSHIYGQLARPSAGDKFPALLIVQWAGVYPLQKPWVTDRAERGWLALNVEPHDLPFDKPAEFYKEAERTTLKNYTSIGSASRDTSYFLRMYLSCYRAAEYLATRPDWDGRTLVVIGTSQGGQQAFVTAGLHPKVTAMIANVPGGCDVTGPKIGRSAGFPFWADQARWNKNDAILEAGRYYDAANFAPRSKGPALVAMGLIDDVCPPAGVYAALNRVPGPKEAVVLVDSDHQGRNNSQAAFYKRSEAWLKALAKGEAVPAK